jgi:hypothetical protein
MRPTGRFFMNHNEIILMNLYMSLQLAKAKLKLFEDKGLSAPEQLVERVEDIETKISELEYAEK